MIPKILICDDHEIQRQNIIDFLHELQVDLYIKECSDGTEALEALEKETFDIILMDIVMKKLDGIETIRRVRKKYPFIFVLFITSHQKYIMKAVSDCHCYDFISKPVNKEAFQENMGLILDKIRNDHRMQQSFDTQKSIQIEYQNISFVIPYEKILFIEQFDYLSIFHTQKQMYQTVCTLADLMKKLDDRFFHCHKSYIVNLQNIHSIKYNPKSPSMLFFKEYDMVALLSSRRKAEFRKVLEDYQTHKNYPYATFSQ